MAELLPSWERHSVESLQAFSKITLIAADLDGTFLSNSDSPASQTLERLRRSLRLYRYDVELTLATGRTLAGVQPILKDLPLSKGIPLILYNGSIVVRNRTLEVLRHEAIPNSVMMRVLEFSSCHPVAIYAYFYGVTSDNILRMTEDREYVLGWSQNYRPLYEFNGLPVAWQSEYEVNVNLAPSAILIEAPPAAVPSIVDFLRDIREISYTRSSSTYIEIRPKDINKAAGLVAAAQALSLSPRNILALGDSDNDAEMLAWAGIGVAVSGASRRAIESSNFICRYGAVRGAIEVLRLVKQARRYYYQPTRSCEGGVRS